MPAWCTFRDAARAEHLAADAAALVLPPHRPRRSRTRRCRCSASPVTPPSLRYEIAWAWATWWPAWYALTVILASPNLDRLCERGLNAKRGLVLREFALGIEALDRFVKREPLRRVHECVFRSLRWRASLSIRGSDTIARPNRRRPVPPLALARCHWGGHRYHPRHVRPRRGRLATGRLAPGPGGNWYCLASGDGSPSCRRPISGCWLREHSRSVTIPDGPPRAGLKP